MLFNGELVMGVDRLFLLSQTGLWVRYMYYIHR
jgi:hypothetical protein